MLFSTARLSLTAAALLLPVYVQAIVAFTDNTFDDVALGQPKNLTWSGDGTPVTIKLMQGDPENLEPIVTVASDVSGSSYEWTPKTLKSGTYCLSITQGSETNYSPQFTLSSTPPPKNKLAGPPASSKAAGPPASSKASAPAPPISKALHPVLPSAPIIAAYYPGPPPDAPPNYPPRTKQITRVPIDPRAPPPRIKQIITLIPIHPPTPPPKNNIDAYDQAPATPTRFVTVVPAHPPAAIIDADDQAHQAKTRFVTVVPAHPPAPIIDAEDQALRTKTRYVTDWTPRTQTRFVTVVHAQPPSPIIDAEDQAPQAKTRFVTVIPAHPPSPIMAAHHPSPTPPSAGHDDDVIKQHCQLGDDGNTACVGMVNPNLGHYQRSGAGRTGGLGRGAIFGIVGVVVMGFVMGVVGLVAV